MHRSVVVAVVGVLFTAGCAARPSAGPAIPTSEAPDTLVALVRESGQRALDATSYTLRVRFGVGGQSITYDFVADSGADAVRGVVDGSEDTAMYKFGDEILTPAPGAPFSGRLVRFEADRLRPESVLRFTFDLRLQIWYVDGVVSAERAGGNTYRGTIDLNRAMDVVPPAAAQHVRSAVTLARDPAAVAYRATIDDQGRLTQMTCTYQQRSGEATVEIDIGGFDAPAAIERPAPDLITDAAEKHYARL